MECKLRKLLPEGQEFYNFSTELQQDIFYIGNERKTIEDYIDNNNSYTAFIETVFAKDTNTLHINFLRSTVKGCGSLLLLFTINRLFKKYNMDVIELDDCSKLCFDERSLYKRFGFEYIDLSFPEMGGNPRVCLRKGYDVVRKIHGIN